MLETNRGGQQHALSMMWQRLVCSSGSYPDGRKAISGCLLLNLIVSLVLSSSSFPSVSLVLMFFLFLKLNNCPQI